MVLAGTRVEKMSGTVVLNSLVLRKERKTAVKIDVHPFVKVAKPLTRGLKRRLAVIQVLPGDNSWSDKEEVDLDKMKVRALTDALVDNFD
ncbi:hypothetical protein R1flu_017992 [Riccia fluitans]|uniref:Uncharacterized protein n=1 Tax=Riccia fluitans TaxID=41844 RepID=A0ABD1ZIH6_9MARC